MGLCSSERNSWNWLSGGTNRNAWLCGLGRRRCGLDWRLCLCHLTLQYRQIGAEHLNHRLQSLNKPWRYHRLSRLWCWSRLLYRDRLLRVLRLWG